jgi:hypothetical protein
VKSIAAATGAGGLFAGVAAGGTPALAVVGALALLILIALCWTISDHKRARNLVSIISALRPPDDPTPPSEPRPRRMRSARRR